MITLYPHLYTKLAYGIDDVTPVGTLAQVAFAFGVGPAALGFAAGLQGGWDVVILCYFVCCGVSRLARFNVTAEALSNDSGKVAYFEGTPIPTSVLLVALLVGLGLADRLGAHLPGGSLAIGGPAGVVLHPLVLVFAVSGSLMISRTVRIPKP